MKKVRFITTLALMAVATHGTVASEIPLAYDDPPWSGTPAGSGARETLHLEPDQRPASIWENEEGAGFRSGLLDAGFEVGGGFGHRAFGSTETHDFAVAKLHLGRMVGGVFGKDQWYRGNWELLGELFAGGQINPGNAYVVGLTPLLRYNFATGTRWVPFIDAGAGVTLTDIGPPDLSTRFQFNTQAGVGVRRFITRHSALTLQYRFFHISNAGIDDPNHGVNTSMFYAGISWFF